MTRSVGLGALAVALAATGCFEARTFSDSTDAADAPLADGPAVDAVDAVDAPEVDAPTGVIDAPVDAPNPIDAPAGDPTLGRAPLPCAGLVTTDAFRAALPAGWTTLQYAPPTVTGNYPAALCGTGADRRYGLGVSYSGPQVPAGTQPAHSIYRTGLPNTFSLSYVVEEADLGGDPEVGLVGAFVLALTTTPAVTYGGVYLAKLPDGRLALRGGTEATPLGYDLAVIGALAPPYRVGLRITSGAGQLAAEVTITTATGRATYNGAVPAPAPPAGLEVQVGTNHYLPTGLSRFTLSELVLP